jgi:hypothetical protein
MDKTNSIKPVVYENVVDPRLGCLEFAQKQQRWGIFTGAEGMNSVQQNASSYSTSGISFNFNTQSPSTIIDRKIYCRAQFQCVFTGRAPVGQPLLSSEFHAPRCLPLSAVTSSLKVSINGSSVETTYNTALQGLLRYNLDDNCKEIDLSMSPSAQDKYQRYIDGVGSVRNPLSNYQNSGKDTGRGAFNLDSISNPVSVDAGADITATVLFTVTEPLLISPMLYKSKDLQAGLIGVNNMAVNFNFASGQLARVWSAAPSGGVTLSNVQCNIGAGTTVPPSLLINYLTPPLIAQSQIPKEINYQYYKVETFTNDQNVSLASNASQTFTNNAIQVSTIPKAIYIFAGRTENTKSYLTSDTFLRINSLSLNFLNVSGQFSSCTIQDLYQMAVKNGCNLSWTEWSGRSMTIGDSTRDGMVGSVLKISVSDLHIPSTVASGMNVNSQLSYTVGLENVNQIEAIDVALTTLLVYDGLMTVSNGSMATQVGVVSSSEVVEARSNLDKFIDWRSAQGIFGGSIFSDLGHYASTGLKAVDALCGLRKMAKGGEHGGQLLSRGQLKDRMFE